MTRTKLQSALLVFGAVLLIFGFVVYALIPALDGLPSSDYLAPISPS